jgi:hypothetical protein
MYNAVINMLSRPDKPEMVWARRAHGDVDPAGNILLRNLEANPRLEHVGIHGRIILKRIIYK